MTHIGTFITESETSVKEKLSHALGTLLERDSYLLTASATERSLSFRLAMYLQQAFPDWDVDIEYNRWSGPCKRTRHMTTVSHTADTDARTAYPDIIIHHRGTHENLAAIEVQKSTNSFGKHQDIKKIQSYKRDSGFHHAIFVDIGVGDDAGRTQVELMP
ncbi:hypothetical protein [Chromohalobacter sp.]|uniref:hypothetical protein n=1 Tax=Chromohalobacter sp. TaxID=50740 RepID=UPI0032422B4C